MKHKSFLLSSKKTTHSFSLYGTMNDKMKISDIKDNTVITDQTLGLLYHSIDMLT